MIKPDVIVTWGRHVDFPLFRYNLERFSSYFSDVHIGLTNHGKLEDYTQFLTTDIKTAKFKNIPMGEGDWRNNAVNEMLRHSTADYVLFIEQDFLIRDERVFEVMLNMPMDFNTVLYDENGRLHPAFALVPRELVEKTSKDFSANPQSGYDHFGKFFRELITIANYCDIEDLGLKSGMDFYHLAGLTQNYHATPFYKPNEFLTYNYLSQYLPIHYNEFKLIMEKISKDNPSFIFNEIVGSMFPIAEDK